jgi:outer membrane receptor protein involved in Fe transport
MLVPRLGYRTDTVQFELFSNIVNAEYGFPGGLPLNTYKDSPTRALQPDREGQALQATSGAILNWRVTNQSQLKLKSSYRTNDWETEDYGFYYKGDDYWIWTGEASYQHSMSWAGIENTILLGMEYRKLHNKPSMYNDDLHGSNLLAKVEVDEGIVGVFIQDELRPIHNLMLNLGVRFDRIETDFENKLNTAASFDSSHRKWSPRLGFTYTVSPSLNIFGNYSQGIRSVNLARPAFRLTSNVKPEKEESIEGGIRGQLLEIFDYNLASFRIESKDKIIEKQRYVYENAGEARSKGFEVSITANLPYGLYITTDYTYLDSEFADFKTSTANYSGKKVPLVPDNIFGLTLGWRSPKYGHISGSLRYVDDKFIDNANTLKLGGYTVVDIKYMFGLKRIFSEQDRLDFSISVNNLFDKTYAEYGETSGGLYAPFPVAFPADGRAVFVSIGYSF